MNKNLIRLLLLIEDYERKLAYFSDMTFQRRDTYESMVELGHNPNQVGTLLNFLDEKYKRQQEIQESANLLLSQAEQLETRMQTCGEEILREMEV